MAIDLDTKRKKYDYMVALISGGAFIAGALAACVYGLFVWALS